METEKPSSFGALVRHYRRLRDWSQEEVADKAGLSLRTLNELERDGVHVPRPETVARLAQVLGLGPAERAAFATAARRLQADALPRGRADQSGGTSSPLALPPLPVPTTRLLGREKGLAEVTALLGQDDVRLVTLTGAGGSGKTRLALAIAHLLQDTFPDGAAFVPLASLADAELVLATIAQGLGLRDVPGQAWPVTFRARLRNRRLLVVVDNFEQLLPAAPYLVDLLQNCTGLTLLVTSRAALRVSSEHEYPVLPLEVPDPMLQEPLEKVAQYPSVALFVARAQAVQPDFRVTKATAPAIAAICRRLDGLPLAIELAAARIRVLDPEAMLARLARRLPLLTGGTRDLPERQRTLRATLDWSHALLTPAEQRLFARLAVFAGGFTLDAAEAVCPTGNATGDRNAGVLDGLERLITQSLVQRLGRAEGEARFSMLETVREYALERLKASGEDAAVSRCHAQYYMALAEAAEPELVRAEQIPWLDRLETEHDNLRAALAWGLAAAGGDEIGVRLAGALWRFWWKHCHFAEGWRWLDAMLTSSAVASATWRAKALHGAGHFAWLQCDLGRARKLHEASLGIRRASGDRSAVAESLNSLGNVAIYQGELDWAHELYHESLAIGRDLGDRYGIARALGNLGDVAAYRGNYVVARALDEESLAISRELADPWSIGHTLGDLGWVAMGEADDKRARTFLEESLAIRQEVGDMWGTAHALKDLGALAVLDHDNVRAYTLLVESLVIHRDVGDKLGLAQSLEGLALLAQATKNFEPAARLLGAAETLRGAIGAPLPPVEFADVKRIATVVLDGLGKGAFELASEKGRAMTLDKAVEYALTEPGMPKALLDS